MKAFRLRTHHFLLAFVALILFCHFASKLIFIQHPEQAEILPNIPASKLNDSIRRGNRLVLFYDSKSESCDYMMYKLSKLRKNHQSDSIIFYRVNINNDNNLINKYRISLAPLILAFKDGKEQQRVMGIVPQSNLEIVRKRLLYSNKNLN